MILSLIIIDLFIVQTVFTQSNKLYSTPAERYFS